MASGTGWWSGSQPYLDGAGNIIWASMFNAIIDELCPTAAGPKGTINTGSGATDVAQRFTNVDTQISRVNTALGITNPITSGTPGTLDTTALLAGSGSLAARLSGLEAKLVPTSGTTGYVLTKTAGGFAWQVASGGGGGGTADASIYYASANGIATTNSAQANGSALRTLFSTVASAGGGHVKFDFKPSAGGTAVIEFNTTAAGGDEYGFYIPSNTKVEIPTGVVLRFMGNSPTLGATVAVPALNFNGSGRSYRLLWTAQNSSNIHIFGGGTIDGNAHNITTNNQPLGSGGSTTSGVTGGGDTSGIVTNGLELYLANEVLVENITIKDCSGQNGGYNENFHLDIRRCSNIRIHNVTVKKTIADANACATGIHVLSSSYVQLSNCRVDDMDVQGFGTYEARNALFDNCYATRNKRGFNVEESQDLYFSNCVAGGRAFANTSNSSADASGGGVYADNADLANSDAGFHIAMVSGGVGNGGLRFSNCAAMGTQGSGSGENGGWTITDGFTFTPTSVSGANIVLANGSASRNASRSMIGAYAQIGTDLRRYRITDVTTAGGATLVLESAPSVTTGTVTIYPRPIVLESCVIANNLVGVQGMTSHAKVLLRCIRLYNCTFEGNSYDLDPWYAYSKGTAPAVSSTAEKIRPGFDITARVDVSSGANSIRYGDVFQSNWPFDTRVYLTGCTSVKVGDFLANPASLSTIPLPAVSSGGAVSKVRVATQTVIGTTLTNDDTITFTLYSGASNGASFEIRGQLLYWGGANATPTINTAGLKINGNLTWTGTASVNQQARVYYKDISAVPVTQTVFPVYNGASAAASPLAWGATPSAYTNGTGGSTRQLLDFTMRVGINAAWNVGNGGITWTLQFAEVGATAGGVTLLDGSYATATPLDSYGSIAGATSGTANTSVILPAGGFIQTTATAAQVFVA